MSTCSLELLTSSALKKRKKEFGALQPTCMNLGETNWRPWLSWDLGGGGLGDLPVRMAQVVMCNHRKLKEAGSVLDTDMSLKRSSSETHSEGRVDVSSPAPP